MMSTFVVHTVQPTPPLIRRLRATFSQGPGEGIVRLRRTVDSDPSAKRLRFSAKKCQTRRASANIVWVITLCWSNRKILLKKFAETSLRDTYYIPPKTTERVILSVAKRSRRTSAKPG